jgi:hypothetical protein
MPHLGAIRGSYAAGEFASGLFFTALLVLQDSGEDVRGELAGGGERAGGQFIKANFAPAPRGLVFERIENIRTGHRNPKRRQRVQNLDPQGDGVIRVAGFEREQGR